MVEVWSLTGRTLLSMLEFNAEINRQFYLPSRILLFCSYTLTVGGNNPAQLTFSSFSRLYSCQNYFASSAPLHHLPRPSAAEESRERWDFNTKKKGKDKQQWARPRGGHASFHVHISSLTPLSPIVSPPQAHLTSVSLCRSKASFRRISNV